MLLPSLFKRFSEINGIFQRLGEEAAGEIDWVFSRRIEEYSETREGSSGLAEVGRMAFGVPEGCFGLVLDEEGVRELLEGVKDSNECFADR